MYLVYYAVKCQYSVMYFVQITFISKQIFTLSVSSQIVVLVKIFDCVFFFQFCYFKLTLFIIYLFIINRRRRVYMYYLIRMSNVILMTRYLFNVSIKVKYYYTHRNYFFSFLFIRLTIFCSK